MSPRDDSRDRSPPPDFAELYEQYAARIYRFCLTLIRDPHAAEDVAADTFVSAMNAYARAPVDAEHLQNWLFQIAKHTAIDHLRRRRRWVKLVPRLQRTASDDIADVEETVVLSMEVARLLQTIATLGRRDQTLIALRVGGGLTYREIGDVLGLSERTAGAATARALHRARKAAGTQR